MEKLERRRLLAKTRSRLKDNIKVDLQEARWGHGLDSSGPVQGRAAGCCECVNEHSISIKCGKFLELLRKYFVYGVIYETIWSYIDKCNLYKTVVRECSFIHHLNVTRI